MGCASCGRGFHEECDVGCSRCHPTVEKAIKTLGIGDGMGAPIKDVDKITDPYSTGRKRAAKQYPIFKTNPCEWRKKKNCGGGAAPITGCIDGFQHDRHHGPVKNPLRNEPGNVHRICKKCHNRWHAENDHIYDEETYNEMPHRPVAATDEELMANEIYWGTK